MNLHERIENAIAAKVDAALAAFVERFESAIDAEVERRIEAAMRRVEGPSEATKAVIERLRELDKAPSGEGCDAPAAKKSAPAATIAMSGVSASITPKKPDPADGAVTPKKCGPAPLTREPELVRQCKELIEFQGRGQFISSTSLCEAVGLAMTSKRWDNIKAELKRSGFLFLAGMGKGWTVGK